MFNGAKETSCGRGETLPVDGMVHLISDGYVGLYGHSGTVRRLLFVYKAGDVIPMMDGIEDPLERTYTYIAMKRTRIKTVSTQTLERYMADPKSVKKMLEYTRNISRLQFERINNMQQTQVFARLIERLLFFARRLGVEDGDKVKIDVPLSHVDIATSISTSRETVNRYMRQLENRGVITVRRQRITINDPQKLQQLLNQKDPLSRSNWTLLGIATAGTTMLAQVVQ